MWVQLAWLLVLNIGAGVAFSGGFIGKNTLYWDNLNLFSFFRDNLHSLNYFGEIQWWHRSSQTSFPIYYASILGTTCATPLFAILGLILWILGRAGIYVHSYHALYVIYTGILVPLVFNVGLWLLARQIFKNRVVIFFVALLGAVSPGVIFNLSSVGLEETAYGLFFAAAYLAFLKRPGKATFIPVLLSSLVLTVSLNHIFLYWNLIFIPLFIIVCHAFSREGLIGTTKKLFYSVPAPYWMVFAFLIFICMLPVLVAFSHGNDILRSLSGTRAYSYSFLRSGNPMEVLSVGVPGIGYEWHNGVFGAHHGGQVSTRYVGYTYLGLMTLPLVFMGLVIGRRVWAKRLFTMITVTATVVILSAYSPFFSSILVWETPLRAVNHYSDTLYRNGIFFIFILTAGLGLEAVMRHERKWRTTLIKGFLWSSLWSVLFFLAVYKTFRSPVFGFIAIMVLLYAVILSWYALAKTAQDQKTTITFLVVLMLIDTFTVAFWHVRNDILPNTLPEIVKREERGLRALGGDGLTSSYANNLLELRSIRELKNKGLDPKTLPVLALFHPAKAGPEGSKTGSPTLDSVPAALTDQDIDAPELFNFIESQKNRKDVSWEISVKHQTYNSLQLEVQTSHEAFVFWRDAHFPYWAATVNGESAPIIEAFGAYKLVAVPHGKSTVSFHFRPLPVAMSLLAAYSAILAVMGCWWFFRHRCAGK